MHRSALMLAALACGCSFETPQTAPRWTQVSAGDGTTCALAGDQALWCWGDNALAQGGVDGADNDLRAPVLVDAGAWTGVSVGRGGWTCGTKADGTLWCWGVNATGSPRVPAQLAGRWQAVTVGYTHACALDDAQHLHCWGDNTYGQLGDGSTTPQAMPTQIGTDRWLHVAAGYYATCGLRSDARVFCWGYNGTGTLGDGTNDNRSRPTEVGGTWQAIALANLHACGIRSDGHLRCWGYNASGQLGDGTTTTRNSPRAIGLDHADWIAIAVGARHTCGQRSDGTLWCWGDDAVGQIGVSESRALVNASPTAIELELVAGIGLGVTHSCAIAGKLGELVCTGANGRGQLGVGDGGSVLAPVAIAGAWDRIVAGGSQSTCGRQEDGSLWCWGDNALAQLGDDIAGPRQVPARIAGGVRNAIAVGNQHACELRGTQVWCWGSNGEGQLGDAVAGVRAPSLVDGVTAVSLAARFHTCAVPAAGGGLVCWGRNTSGQLGRGDKVAHTDLVPVQTTFEYAAVGTGIAHTCVVHASTGRLACWGDNSQGQLGTGQTAESLVPAEQPTMGWSAVATGYYHTCGIRAGQMFCWGLNASGQLGVAAPANALTAVQVGTAASWQQVVAGIAHTCGLQLDHTLWCWGSNNRGQLGLGDYEPRSEPTQVGPDRDWEYVGAGDSHTCATKQDGTLWCWGSDEAGQIGDATAWRAVWTPR